MGSILALNHKFFNASKTTGETKGSPLWVFFRHYATFFEKFWNLSKGTPCIFLKFSVCRKRWMSLNGLFLSFSALCDLKNIFRKKFKKIFFPNFYNSGSLNIFEPKIWRRLGTFPSCFLFSHPSHCAKFYENRMDSFWAINSKGREKKNKNYCISSRKFFKTPKNVWAKPVVEKN